MDRDLIGYGKWLPKVVWPHHAHIAINFVLNYEEGSEKNVLDGDSYSEYYLADWPGLIPLKGERSLSSESLFEYGSRVGVWRLLDLFNRYRIPLTLFTTGLALKRNPPLANELKESSHEIAGHGFRWINYSSVPEELEREHINQTIQIIEDLTQKKVRGWYTGRRSVNTRQLLVDVGLRYDSESYADDLPYWVKALEKPYLVIPYNLDTNDARYAISPGWNTGDDFFHYLKATFDCLYREGSDYPKMMTIGLHARLSGRPGRTEALYRFVDYIKQFDHVWLCKREEIADHWYRYHSI